MFYWSQARLTLIFISFFLNLNICHSFLMITILQIVTIHNHYCSTRDILNWTNQDFHKIPKYSDSRKIAVIIAPLWKSGGYTEFTLSFSHSVILWFRNLSNEHFSNIKIFHPTFLRNCEA